VVAVEASLRSGASVLVLFDIDGTLVHTVGAGVRGMTRAFLSHFGMPDALDGLPIAGRTDRAIVTEAFTRAGVEPTEDRIDTLRSAYLAELPAAMAVSGQHGFGVLPGVHDAIDAIERDPRFTLALLTGNFAGGAEIKLGHFDLWRRFAFGAFGDDHTDRRDLVPLATARAAARGPVPTDVIVIGDTPLDVDCAHAHGALAVAVTTGPYGRAVLDEAGADVVVATLDALAPVAERLLDLCRERRVTPRR
jgi:phosphoglycolate phosphatase